jgi:hypothetical protein
MIVKREGLGLRLEKPVIHKNLEAVDFVPDYRQTRIAPQVFHYHGLAG